jgi:hypothetical protein
MFTLNVLPTATTSVDEVTSELTQDTIIVANSLPLFSLSQDARDLRVAAQLYGDLYNQNAEYPGDLSEKTNKKT